MFFIIRKVIFPLICICFPLPSLINLFLCLCVFALCLFFPLSKLETQQGELSPKDPRCPHSFDITWKLFQTTSFVIFESFSFVSIYHFETYFNIKLNCSLPHDGAMPPARRLDQKPMLDDGQQAGWQSRNISIFN